MPDVGAGDSEGVRVGKVLRGKERTEAEWSQAGGRGTHLPMPAPPPLQGLDRNNKREAQA